MTDQKKIDEARKLFEEQEIAQGRSVEMTSCGEYLDGVVFFGWLNELDRIDAEYAQAQKAAEQCETMQRPKSECGCPDCGSSLIDCPETEPAPAQDEREAFIQRMIEERDITRRLAEYMWDHRPAQTEQQPAECLSEEAASTLRGMVEYCLNQRVCMGMDEGFKSFDPEEEHDFVKELRAFAEGAAPIAQTAPQPEQSRLAEALEELLAGTGTSPGANKRYGKARAALDAYRAALSAQGGDQ